MCSIGAVWASGVPLTDSDGDSRETSAANHIAVMRSLFVQLLPRQRLVLLPRPRQPRSLAVTRLHICVTFTGNHATLLAVHRASIKPSTKLAGDPALESPRLAASTGRAVYFISS